MLRPLITAKGRRVALREFLDDGLEGATLAMSRRSRVARLLVTSLVGGLLAFHFGAKPALLWGAVNLSLEGWLVYLQLTFKPREQGRTALFVRIGPPAVGSSTKSSCTIMAAPRGGDSTSHE